MVPPQFLFGEHFSEKCLLRSLMSLCIPYQHELRRCVEHRLNCVGEELGAVENE